MRSRSSRLACSWKLGEGELRGAIDGNEQMELAFSGAHFGDVDVEVADRVALECLLAALSRPRSQAAG